MTLKKVTSSSAEQLRDGVEEELSTASSRAMRLYLNDTRQLTLGGLSDALTAAGGDELPTIGQLASTWAQHVDVEIMTAVSAAVARSFRRYTDLGLDVDSPSWAASQQYLATVRNRLVNGTFFGSTVYQESFDRIRASLAESVAAGWSRRELAERIAVELDWAKRTPYWKAQLANIDKQIDDILDPLGPPGTPVREAARLNDPRVNMLRTERNTVIKRLDDEHSTWKTRADLIARTESTGAANYGGFQAMVAEGVQDKVWVATGDRRTRPTHRAASGVEVPLASSFLVGTSLLMFPGDPNGPAQETANCRCTMIAGEYALPQDRKVLQDISEGEEGL